MPFCSLTSYKGQHPSIREFAWRYGRPERTCAVGKRVCCFVRGDLGNAVWQYALHPPPPALMAQINDLEEKLEYLCAQLDASH